MKRFIVVAALLAAATASGSGKALTQTPQSPAALAQPDADDTQIREIVGRIEQIAARSDIPTYLDLLSASADRADATEFATSEFRPGATRVVMRERERRPLAGEPAGTAYSLALDAFAQYGDHARIVTWRLDVKRIDGKWAIAGQQRLSSVENLYRLSLDSEKQFTASNFVVLAEDLELTLIQGSVFVITTGDQGVTGLVLLGQGEMRFHPAPVTEKGQVRIFAGAETLETGFEAAYVRAGSIESHADLTALTARSVDPRDLKRAQQIYLEESVKSFAVDLGDLSRDAWSLLPGFDDFLAEVRTKRYRTLTYARSSSEPEDITVFERERKRNISVYASKAKLDSRGPIYNEDDLSPFDVLDYDVKVTSIPDRQWIDGRTTMRLRVKASSVGQLTLHLADTLIVRSVVSDAFGHLFSLRVANQDTILINLPVTVTQGTQMSLTIVYGGRLEPQKPDNETLIAQGSSPAPDVAGWFGEPEPNYLYSTRSYWYAQSSVSDYATATIQITVPPGYTAIASGEESLDSPQPAAGTGLAPGARVFSFTAERPLRYLAFVVSRFARADQWTVSFDDSRPPLERPIRPAPGLRGAPYNRLDLIVDVNPRQLVYTREIAARSADIFQYYEALLGDSPYSTFTIAVVENTLPGGHSPAYFATLNQPLPNSGLSWRNDPATFLDYPEFFLAHEIGHQWWGQAVGWRNYHEQWLSEGFSQYFAALYARKFRGEDTFASVLRQMRKWTLDKSDEGPVYLGYRVGHIRSDGRAFRAVVYNKGALVLHMLRRLVGDDVFFRGIRRFYGDARFTKVGTDDFRQAMEAESGRSLERFFDRWIYNSTLPRVRFTYRVEQPPASRAPEVVMHFEQVGDIFDVPITVTLRYTGRKSVDFLVPVTDRTVEFRAPLEGTLQRAEISRNDGTPVEVVTVR